MLLKRAFTMTDVRRTLIGYEGVSQIRLSVGWHTFRTWGLTRKSLARRTEARKAFLFQADRSHGS